MGADVTGGSLGAFGAYLPMLLILAAMYFMMILPQKKQEKKRKEMLDGLQKGDQVVTIGGILGEISSLDEEKVNLKVADNVEIQFMRTAVGRKIEK